MINALLLLLTFACARADAGVVSLKGRNCGRTDMSGIMIREATVSLLPPSCMPLSLLPRGKNVNASLLNVSKPLPAGCRVDKITVGTFDGRTWYWTGRAPDDAAFVVDCMLGRVVWKLPSVKAGKADPKNPDN